MQYLTQLYLPVLCAVVMGLTVPWQRPFVFRWLTEAMGPVDKRSGPMVVSPALALGEAEG